MKFCIKHESTGRIRIQMAQKRMTLEQADLLEAYLQSLPQVRQATVHERTCCAIIRYQSSKEALLRHISRFSYEMEFVTDLSPQKGSRSLNREYEEKLVGMVAFKAARSLFFPAPLNMVYTLWQSIPYVFRGVKSLLRGQLHVEVLDGLSIGISVVRRDFDTAGSVMFLLGLGELLEEWTHKKSVDDLARCMSLNVDRVWLKTPEGDVLTHLTQIQPDDRIALHMGGVVPLDGVIDEGEVMVNQASLTGESVPVPKREGMTVYAGTVVEEGNCTLRVTQQSGSSRYDKIVSMIEESEKLKSAAENKASDLADKLVPYTLAGSVLAYVLTRNVTRALSVLMVDFSCALKLSMPLAVLSAMREAGYYHITVKGGKYLEAMSQADTIVFDKTGTLTYASPVVAQVIPFGGHDEGEMLRLAACLEEHFPHSMANAVVQAARERGLSHEEMHSQVDYLVAHGIASTVGGRRVVIGSVHFVFEDEHCTVPPEEQDRFDTLPPEYSHLYLSIGGVLAAVICIADPLREEAKAVIQELRRLGIRKTVMLTGDSERTAAAIAAQVGVDEYHAEVLPEDKANFVEAERAHGHTVIMLGDGINDSPALSMADVGIAISDGAAIAREIADITIAADSLYELVTLRRIAAGLMGRIRSNYRFVIGFNGGLIGLGAAGLLMPSTSALLHNVSTIGVSLRSMTNLLEEAPCAQPLPAGKES
jgi:heavy metal translocating P-type ATPase